MDIETERAIRRVKRMAGAAWFFGAMAWMMARAAVEEAFGQIRGGR
ncbi:hypothetical protein [Sorangium sp. So ce1024]